MSDLSENPIIQEGEDEHVPEIDNTNYFKEQDEKFEELHKKLQKLKEENKKQIDAIINSLDDLMASKCVIEQTLEKVPIPDDLPIEITKEKLNVVDLLSKVTGIVNDSNNELSNASKNKECETENDGALQGSKEEQNSQTDKMDCTDNMLKGPESTRKTDDSSLLNSKAIASQVIDEDDKSQTADKMDLTSIKVGPLVNSED